MHGPISGGGLADMGKLWEGVWGCGGGKLRKGPADRQNFGGRLGAEKLTEDQGG